MFKITEETKDQYSKKQMVKQPNEFWSYYYNNIFNQNIDRTDIDKAINRLISTGLIKTTINLNYNDYIYNDYRENNKTDLIALKGNYNIVRCMSCDKEYNLLDNPWILNDKSNKIRKCKCGGKIIPTVTMFGEKYRSSLIERIKDSIFTVNDNNEVDLNTHTLIFIGVDFEEDYMHELIESYNAIKLKTTQENSYCVMICEMDGVSIEYYQPEFATYEDIAGSINRLIDKLEEEDV